MPTGLFRQLPPGLSGYVAAEQLANQRAANEFNMRRGIFGLQQEMQAAPIQQEMQRLQLEKLRNPAPAYERVKADESLVEIPRGGAPRTVMSGQPKPQRPIEVTTVSAEGKPVTRFLDPSQVTGQEFPRPVTPSAPDRPYYTPVPTAGGMMSFDNRTGQLAPSTYGGKAVIPAAADPKLKADLGYGGRAGSEAAEADVTQHETAIAAVENIAKIDDLLKHLKTSDAITGLGAETLKNIERAKVFVASSEAAGKKVSDTELLNAMMGQEVFPMIKALGIGARGLDTPAEREFLRQVMSGTVDLNKETLVKLTEMRRNIAERAVDRWNRRVGAGELDRFFTSTGRLKRNIEKPKRTDDPQRRSTDTSRILEEADAIIGR